MTDHAVVIAGGGPTGLMLAGELALQGVDVAIVEKRPDQQLAGSRAGGLHARTIEILDQRGIADRFLAEGKPAQVTGFGWIPLSIADFPTRYPYGLGLWQNHIERLLAGWVEELGVPILRGREVTGFVDTGAQVEVALSSGETIRAAYLVGCDGGRSLVRKTAGIAFVGSEPTVGSLIAEVEMRDEPIWGMQQDERGIRGISRLIEGQPLLRVMVPEPHLDRVDEPGLDDLSEALVAAYGRDFGPHSPVWISRFTDAARQAEHYHKGRVLLAGDAAHVHNPVGGQGLNIGVQDAVNLGWKLAQVVKGISPDTLLDTYHAERHPIAARVLRNTLAQVALIYRTDERTAALRETMAELFAMDEPRKRFGAMQSGLGVHYDLGAGHPVLGRRMPDLDVVTVEGPTRVYALMHAAQPLLLDFGLPGSIDLAGWSDRVRRVDATTGGPWDLPAIGIVPAPAAVLIRPDGYVAWVGIGTDDGLRDALEKWFGPPAAW